MKIERRESELWQDGDWRCERWMVAGRHQVRLYLGPQLVSDLLDGPNLNLLRQTAEWRTAVQADMARSVAGTLRTRHPESAAEGVGMKGC